MNHQDVAGRLKNLGDEKSKALYAEEARIERERLSLQELCGGMGHVYVASPTSCRYSFNSPTVIASTPARVCAVCGKEEV